MKSIMDKMKIIWLKESGYSNRYIARQSGYDRKTVALYWDKYRKDKAGLMESAADIKLLQEEMCSEPKYDSSNRKRRKVTDKLIERLQLVLVEEAKKDKILGIHNTTLISLKNLKNWRTWILFKTKKISF